MTLRCLRETTEFLKSKTMSHIFMVFYQSKYVQKEEEVRAKEELEKKNKEASKLQGFLSLFHLQLVAYSLFLHSKPMCQQKRKRRNGVPLTLGQYLESPRKRKSQLSCPLKRETPVPKSWTRFCREGLLLWNYLQKSAPPLTHPL